MSNSEIASSMIAGLSTISGVIISDVSLSGESPSFVVRFPAGTDGKRRPSRVPPQTQRRSFSGHGEMTVEVLADAR